MCTQNIKDSIKRLPQEITDDSATTGMVTTLLLFVLGITGFCSAALPLPSYIEPCSLSNPNFKQCVVEHARKTIPHIVFTGDKKYKVPVLEPLEVEEIRIEQGASQVGLTLIIRNCKIYGIKDMHVENVDFDFEKNQMYSELHLPNPVILGNYTGSGRILLLPVYGKGDINITLTDAVAKFTVDFKIVTKEDGLEYLSIYNPRGTLEVSRMYLDIKNLFNGDKLLGEQTNAVLNENWKEVYHDLEPAIKECLAVLLNTILSAFVDLVPFNEIFPK